MLKVYRCAFAASFLNVVIFGAYSVIFSDSDIVAVGNNQLFLECSCQKVSKDGFILVKDELIFL